MIRSILFFSLVINGTACNLGNTSTPRSKTFIRKIKHAKVLGKLDYGHGDFGIIFRENNITDTISINSYPKFKSGIDTQTVLEKSDSSYELRLYNFLDNGKRISKTINLIYW